MPYQYNYFIKIEEKIDTAYIIWNDLINNNVH